MFWIIAIPRKLIMTVMVLSVQWGGQDSGAFCMVERVTIKSSMTLDSYSWVKSSWSVTFREKPEAILFPGQWWEEGYETNFNSSVTVCTHFAILLSARPLNISPQKHWPCRSLVTFVSPFHWLLWQQQYLCSFSWSAKLVPNFPKGGPLFIPCITTFIFNSVQHWPFLRLFFIAGVEPRLGMGHLVGGIPIGCRLVAVLLHYWFLVSFMWMLMEGVVLYVAVVKLSRSMYWPSCSIYCSLHYCQLWWVWTTIIL